MIKNFQRNAVSSDKSHQLDYMKNQLLLELQNQKQKYIKKPKKKYKIKNVFNSNSVSRNNEIAKRNIEPTYTNKNLLGKNKIKNQTNMINYENRTYNEPFLIGKKNPNSNVTNRYIYIKKFYSGFSSKNKKYDKKVHRSSSAFSKRYKL